MLAELSPAIRLLWGLLGKAQRLQLNEKWCTDLSPRAPGTVGGPREAPDADSATPDAVAGAILQGDGRDDWQEMREYVLAAEHMGFTRAQNTRLAPRLLDIAVAHRDSSDPLDEPVVLSAIRTGASMLRPEQAHRLGPLLESGHAIETSLVAMKMLGRVFEAQPPSGVDQYPDLATEVGQIARDLLKAPMLASRRLNLCGTLGARGLSNRQHVNSDNCSITGIDNRPQLRRSRSCFLRDPSARWSRVDAAFILNHRCPHMI
jgi:hypothetical protein